MVVALHVHVLLLLASEEGGGGGVLVLVMIKYSTFLYKYKYISARVAEVAREHGWYPPKILDWDKNFKPEHTLFCRKLRFVAIYALFFGDLWA